MIDDCNDAAELREILKQEFATFTTSNEVKVANSCFNISHSSAASLQSSTRAL
jgi:hypothetical protein